MYGVGRDNRVFCYLDQLKVFQESNRARAINRNTVFHGTTVIDFRPTDLTFSEKNRQQKQQTINIPYRITSF